MWFAVRFLGDDSEINIRPVDHSIEFESWRWVPVGELIESIVPFKRDVYRAVVKELGPLAVAADP